MLRHITALLVLLLIVLLIPTAAAQDGSDTAADPLGGATEFAVADERTSITLMLDWTPNTNHTGFYVALAEGYYDDANLDVAIIEPTDFFPEQALDAGLVQFGVGFQDFSTPAMAQGIDLVSVAAIIQNNTSGFVTLAEDHTLSTPSDLTTLNYGGFGLPDFENAFISTLAACDDASWDEGNYIDIGFADVIELMDRNRVDFGWIFYGWQGINAELDGRDLSRLMLMDYADCIPNYYTPILLTTQSYIDERPDVVAAFVQATARGYAVAIQDPEQAAETLIDAVPELNADLVTASALYLAEQYQADAPRWGQQTADTWTNFTDFLTTNDIIEDFDPSAAWTNEFLPGTVE